jgi:hypothetical protein
MRGHTEVEEEYNAFAAPEVREVVIPAGEVKQPEPITERQRIEITGVG